MIKKIVKLVSFVVCVPLFFSCGGKTQQMQKKIDSLETLYSQRDGDYNRLNEYLTVIATGLDSISAQEGMIMSNNIPGESPVLNRETIRRNLDTFKELLDRQKNRLEELESDLSKEQGDVLKLRAVIATMKAQLEAKDAEIAQIRADLDNKNKSVQELVKCTTMLTSQSDEQKRTIESQEQVMKQQEEVIKVQDDMINEGFVKLATKKELTALGLLNKGNLFKKKRVNYSGIDRRLFQTVDIRHATEIPLPSKKVKIWSPMPQGSYQVVEKGGQFVLRITDPTRFWSVSNYLIIQTD